NVYVNAINHGFDPRVYLAAIPGEAVAELHLAGFDASGPCLIDTHGTRVAPAVWTLYRATIHGFGVKPTLIEWDIDLPGLRVLQGAAGQPAVARPQPSWPAIRLHPKYRMGRPSGASNGRSVRGTSRPTHRPAIRARCAPPRKLCPASCALSCILRQSASSR